MPIKRRDQNAFHRHVYRLVCAAAGVMAAGNFAAGLLCQRLSGLASFKSASLAPGGARKCCCVRRAHIGLVCKTVGVRGVFWTVHVISVETTTENIHGCSVPERRRRTSHRTAAPFRNRAAPPSLRLSRLEESHNMMRFAFGTCWPVPSPAAGLPVVGKGAEVIATLQLRRHWLPPRFTPSRPTALGETDPLAHAGACGIIYLRDRHGQQPGDFTVSG
jgi:hypothetical protein